MSIKDPGKTYNVELTRMELYELHDIVCMNRIMAKDIFREETLNDLALLADKLYRILHPEF